MNAALKQARDGILASINDNPTTIIIYTSPTTTDPQGNTVPDPFATKVESGTARVRLSHERKGPDPASETEAGFSTNLGRYILSDYQTPLEAGQVFPDTLGKSWQIMSVDPLQFKGDIIGYQAPLKEATSANS